MYMFQEQTDPSYLLNISKPLNSKLSDDCQPPSTSVPCYPVSAATGFGGPTWNLLDLIYNAHLILDCLQSVGVRSHCIRRETVSEIPILLPTSEVVAIDEDSDKIDHIKAAVFIHRGVATVVAYSVCPEWLWEEKAEVVEAVLTLNTSDNLGKVAVAEVNRALVLVQYASEYARRLPDVDFLALIDNCRALFHTHKSLLRRLSNPFDVYTAARKVFTALGYRNIRDVAGSRHFLIIAKVEDSLLPDPVQTFPVKIESVNTVLTLRILFSHRNAVAAFEKGDFDALAAIALQVNELIGEQMYIVEKEKMQVHCCQRLYFADASYKQFSETLNQTYTRIIDAYIWTCLAFYQYYTDRRKSVEDCIAHAQRYNPGLPTEPYGTYTFQSHESYTNFKATVRRLEQESIGPIAAGMITYDDARRCIDIRRPKSALSLTEIVSQGGTDLTQLCAEVEKLTAEYRRRGVFITPDMAFIGADLPVVRVIPIAPFPPTVEEAAVKSYQFFLKTVNSVVPRSSNYAGWVNCEGIRDQRWIADCVTGELCGRKVRGIQCGDHLIADTRLTGYLEALKNCEKVAPTIGISAFCDPSNSQVYHTLMHEYGAFDATSWALSVVKSVGNILQTLHNQGKAHGFLSEFTISYTDGEVRLVLPCVYPAFFPLVNSLFAKRPEVLLAPNLRCYSKYSISPTLADLQAADVWALARLTTTHCLPELRSSAILLEVNKGLIDDIRSRASLELVMRAIGEIGTEL